MARIGGYLAVVISSRLLSKKAGSPDSGRPYESPVFRQLNSSLSIVLITIVRVVVSGRWNNSPYDTAEVAEAVPSFTL